MRRPLLPAADTADGALPPHVGAGTAASAASGAVAAASAYEAHGAALLDCFRGDGAATLICHQDGERDDVPAAFWLRETLDALELQALDLCRGRVLDLGAGAGPHALALQRQGHDVTAIDIVPECVSIMLERGVRNALHADLFTFEGGPFDTVISLCNGLDKVGRLTELPRFLDRMRQLLVPTGQLIVDSFDLRVGADDACLARMARKHAAGRYFGEMDLAFEYGGRTGAPFCTLQVDFETFVRIAASAGWEVELLAMHGRRYLARGVPK